MTSRVRPTRAGRIRDGGAGTRRDCAADPLCGAAGDFTPALLPPRAVVVSAPRSVATAPVPPAPLPRVVSVPLAQQQPRAASAPAMTTTAAARTSGPAVSATQQPAAQSTMPSEPRPVALAQLSADQRRELPAMVMGGSIWSDNARAASSSSTDRWFVKANSRGGCHPRTHRAQGGHPALARPPNRSAALTAVELVVEALVEPVARRS
jgi:hypothetical protein